jgi:hypothetical protein
MNCEFGEMYEQAVMTYFKILCQHVFGDKVVEAKEQTELLSQDRW